MNERSEAERMLALAHRDLRSLSAVTDNADFAEETFGFLAQQTVEKGLKAVLSAQGVVYPLTHNLETLFGAISGAVALEPYRDLTGLFPYAVLFRYSEAEESEPFDRKALHDRLIGFLGAVRSEIAL